MRDRGNKDITKEGRELGRGGSVRDRVRIRILQRKVEN